MRNLKVVFVCFFLILINLSCIKINSKNVVVTVYESNSIKKLSNKKVVRYHILPEPNCTFFCDEVTTVIDSVITNSKGEAVFESENINLRREHHFRVFPESNYSGSTLVANDDANRVKIYVAPIISKTVLINKPADITKMIVTVNGRDAIESTSEFFEHNYNFVTDANNLIIVESYKDLVIVKRSELLVVPKKNDTKSVRVEI